MPRSAKLKRVERYELERSPLAQKPTQREIAVLLSETRDDLRRLVNYKNEFIVRRQITTGKKGKVRDLAYPVSRLRAAHERLKFHLNKVKQPSYLFSPRTKRGQRDNAALHLDQDQYLTLDLKQFYPSTSEDMVRRWFRDELGMYDGAAGLKSHSIRYRSGNRPVFITGIGVVGSRLVAPNSLNLKIRECWAEYHDAETDYEQDFLTQRLLTYLGTVRQIAGAKSEVGRKVADEMNSLRQKRNRRYLAAEEHRRLRREEQSKVVTTEIGAAPF